MVIEVDHVRPVAHFVAGFSVRAAIEKVGVLMIERRIRGRVVIHNVDHAFHADGMDGQEPDDIRAQCADAV